MQLKSTRKLKPSHPPRNPPKAAKRSISADVRPGTVSHNMAKSRYAGLIRPSISRGIALFVGQPAMLTGLPPALYRKCKCYLLVAEFPTTHTQTNAVSLHSSADVLRAAQRPETCLLRRSRCLFCFDNRGLMPPTSCHTCTPLSMCPAPLPSTLHQGNRGVLSSCYR